MKKLTSLEDTATITITGREAVALFTVVGRTAGALESFYDELKRIVANQINLRDYNLPCIQYDEVKEKQEALAFPQPSKKNLMLKELQSKMDALQCEIDKIKGEEF